MSKFQENSSYMDYRNTVPFVNLSGYIVTRPKIVDEIPAKSLQEQLIRKKCSSMINLRRLQYCCRAEGYRNGKY